MKKILIIILVLVLYIIASFFFPIVPVRVPSGYHGQGGEFCGIRYTPDCDEIVTRFYKASDAYYGYLESMSANRRTKNNYNAY